MRVLIKKWKREKVLGFCLIFTSIYFAVSTFFLIG